ncbi:MAG TPA: hypothetical protein PLY97_11095 [Acidocella sp.]|nr:MAG: hypothetical protein B7Z81_08265 [Acidocella sp. 20-61-6]HQT47758.1 hypothetical protein [Acidocella sp.]
MVGVFLYLLFAVMSIYAQHGYASLLWAADAMPQTLQPFNDLNAILQAGACWREGVNVYVPNLCMHGGVYNYSPFLLKLIYFLSGLQSQRWGGVFLGGGFLAALSALPQAQTRGELALRVMTTCSGTVIFALERANLDVVIFLLILLGVFLLRLNRWTALLGYGVFGLAAACKFYPAVLLGLMVRERLTQVLILAVSGLGAGVLYLLFFAHGTTLAISNLPLGLPFKGIFGAMDIPFGLVLLHFMPALTLTPDAAQYLAGVDHPKAIGMIGLATKVLTLAGLIAGIGTSRVYDAAYRRCPQDKSLLLVAGAMVLVFCFYLTQNIPYRAIFLLLTLPGFWAMAIQSTGAMRRRGFWAVGVMAALLWEDALRNVVASAASALLSPAHAFYLEFVFFLVSECLWWWVIIQLSGVVLCFIKGAFVRLLEQAAGFKGVLHG